MNTSKRVGRHLSAVLILCSMVFSGCGKVTQVAEKKEKIKSFDLEFQLEIAPTHNLTLKGQAQDAVRPFFTILDTTLYAQIEGIDQAGKFHRLSWGKGIISPKTLPPTTGNAKTKTIYEAQSFDIHNIKRTQANHTWTNFTFNTTASQWQIAQKKVEKKHPLYIVKTFSTKSNYQMAVITEKTVSENRNLSLGALDRYQTFLSVLFLSDLSKNGKPLAPEKLEKLADLFNRPFFSQLKWAPPANQTQKFTATSPLFLFETPIETQLLTLFKLSQDSHQEAKNYLTKTLKKSLPQPAYLILSKNLTSFSLE